MSKNTENLDELYNKCFPKDRRPICPKCGTSDNVRPFLFGYPSNEAFRLADAGYIQLMGCCISTNENGEIISGRCEQCSTEIYKKYK